MATVIFKEWAFEVDKELNRKAYEGFVNSGADTCDCGNCKNYLKFRESVFPVEIKSLFNDLGIDYKKEFDIITNYKTSNGLYNTMGWFHFKGNILSGKNCAAELPNGGHSVEVVPVLENFAIGFATGTGMTYFEDESGLIEFLFETDIPWVIDLELE